MNRLKIIVKDYEKTIFIEEALHRLVEINYHIGLEQEAKSMPKFWDIIIILASGLNNLIRFLIKIIRFYQKKVKLKITKVFLRE